MGLSKKHQQVRSDLFQLELPVEVRDAIWKDYLDAERLIAEEDLKAGKGLGISAETQAMKQRRYRARVDAERKGLPVPAWARKR